MSVMNPFRKNGATSYQTVSTTPTTATQPSTGSIQGMLATWIGSIPCYLEYGASAGSSGLTATIPTSSTPGSMPILPNTAPSLTVPPNCYVSAMTSAASGGILMLTPGDGF